MSRMGINPAGQILGHDTTLMPPSPFDEKGILNLFIV
jgi:hypothetical protein